MKCKRLVMCCLSSCLYVTKTAAQKRGGKTPDPSITEKKRLDWFSFSKILFHYRRVTSMNRTRDCRQFQPFKKMYFLCLKSSEKERAALIRVCGQAIILLINESHCVFLFIICRLLCFVVLAAGCSHCSHPFFDHFV